MNFKEFWRREKYVALHAQTCKFRVIKYIVIVALLTSVYLWKDWMTVGGVLAAMFVLSLAMHFLFRWKTKAWTQSWGPYKKIDLPV